MRKHFPASPRSRSLEARSWLGRETFRLCGLNVFVSKNYDYGGISLKLFFPFRRVNLSKANVLLVVKPGN